MVTRIDVTYNWSVDYDGKSILMLLATKPKMTYGEILIVIKAEGGYVDEKGIVHKGTARNKVYTLD